MPTSDGTRAYKQSTVHGERLLLTPELSPEAAQETGRWVASLDMVEVRE